MQQMINIKLGDWLPDQENTGLQGHLKEACNVLPTEEGYGPMPSFQKLEGPNLPQTCEGFIIHQDKEGKAHMLIGCQDGLYSYKNKTWSNLHPKDKATHGHWSFSPWGEGIIVNHPATPLLYYNEKTQGVVSLTSFHPQAKTLNTIKDYVFLGGFRDHPYRLMWSALNNPTDFKPSLTTHADYQDLPYDKGRIQKIIGHFVVTDKTLYQLRYVGVPYIWQLVEIPGSYGTIVAGSVVKQNDWIFYLAENGFHLFDGKKIYPIGKQRVNKTFFKKLDLTWKKTIKSTIDPVKNLVFWSYPTKSHKRELLIYNWQTQQWSWSDQELACLGYFDRHIVGIYQNHLATLSGLPHQAVLETWDHNFIPTQRSWLMGIHVVGPHNPAKIQVKVDDHPQVVSYQPKKWHALYPVRSNGYRHRIKLHFSGPFAPQKQMGFKVKAMGR